MSTQIDWQAELDRAIEHPPVRPATEYVASGRRAVRRRRASASAACLVTVFVAGGLGWAALPDVDRPSAGSRTAGQGPSPTEPTGSPSSQDGVPDPAVPPSGYRGAPLDPGWGTDEPPARLHPDGGFEVRPGAAVLQHRGYPRGGGTEGLAALTVEYDAQRWWVLLDWAGASSGVIHAAPDEDDGPETDGSGGLTLDEVPEELATWTPNGLELRDGVSLEGRVENPFGLAPPESSLGLALEYEGTTTWVIATTGPTASSTSSVNAADSGWLTFDQWLDEQVARRADGPGVRLVTMNGDGTLTPKEPGVEVVDELREAVLSSYEDAAPTPGTLGMLRWEGGTWFVHVTREDVRTSCRRR